MPMPPSPSTPTVWYWPKSGKGAGVFSAGRVSAVRVSCKPASSRQRGQRPSTAFCGSGKRHEGQTGARAMLDPKEAFPAKGYIPFSVPCQGRKEISDFVFHLGGIGDRFRNLRSQDLAVALPQPVDRRFEGACRQSEPLGDSGAFAASGLAEQKGLEAVETVSL